MAKVAAEALKKMSSISGIAEKLRLNKHKFNSTVSPASKKNSIIRNIFHPDYVLFDWEFFSHELEFE